MALTRRGWMAAAAGLATTPALAAAASQADGRVRFAHGPVPELAPVSELPVRIEIISRGDHDYGPALRALTAYARAELRSQGLPGMTLAVTDLDGFAATVGIGWADRERRRPVGPNHRFQIGSISKSFIALTVLSLVDEGRFHLDDRAAHLLPEAPWPDAPITLAHLLSHVSGLPDGAPVFPRTPDGRLWSGFPLGSRFSYSNTGFELIGRMIERATGMPHQKAVDRQVRDKLGLGAMTGVIDQARRSEFAVGYWPWDQVDAGGELPKGRLETAYWTPEDTPAGSIGATSGEMAVYLRALTRFARGHGGSVLSDASALRFATPVIAAKDFGPGARYALGVAVAPVEGEDCLHHTGGMMSFSSSFHADPGAGVACFASVNARLGPYRPRVTTSYAVRLLRAARRGQPLPAAPDPLAPFRVKTAEDWAGRYVGPKDALRLVATPFGLAVRTDDGAARATPQGADRIATDHPHFSRYGFDAVREGGRITALWWGDRLYGREEPRAQPTAAESLKPLIGVYLCRDPWVGGAEVLARGGELVVEGGGTIKDRGGWWSTTDDPGGVERLRFEAPMNGVMRRCNASGADMLRLTV